MIHPDAFPHERTVAKLHRNFLSVPKQYIPLTTMGEKGRELPHVTRIETKQQTVLNSFRIKSLGKKELNTFRIIKYVV